MWYYLFWSVIRSQFIVTISPLGCQPPLPSWESQVPRENRRKPGVFIRPWPDRSSLLQLALLRFLQDLKNRDFTACSQLSLTTLFVSPDDEPQGVFAGEPLTHGIKITMTSLYAVSFLFGLVGNALGLYIICRKCGMKAATHLLIANLACSNLLITFIVMPMSVLFLYNEHRWHSGTAGAVTCKLSQYLFLFPIATSILTILVVSIDRFFAVFYPLDAKVFRRPKIMTATIWICSAILMSPTLAIYKVISSPDGKWFCVSYFSQDSHLADILSKVYYSLIFVLLYLLPLLAIAVLYTLICYKLYHRKVPGLSRAEAYRQGVEKLKRKVVKVLIMIVVVFALCWFPAHAMHYYITFQSEFYARMPAYLLPLLLWISHTNSAIEPCLYILLSQNFRREFRKVISHCGFYHKKIRLQNRLSKLTFNFSKRNWDAYRNGSFISFRKADTFKVDTPHIMEGGEKDDSLGLNMRNWSPTEQYHRGQQKLDDHVLWWLGYSRQTAVSEVGNVKTNGVSQFIVTECSDSEDTTMILGSLRLKLCPLRQGARNTLCSKHQSPSQCFCQSGFTTEG